MINEFIPSKVPLEQRTVGHILAQRAEEFGDRSDTPTTGFEAIQQLGDYEVVALIAFSNAAGYSTSTSSSRSFSLLTGSNVPGKTAMVCRLSAMIATSRIEHSMHTG